MISSDKSNDLYRVRDFKNIDDKLYMTLLATKESEGRYVEKHDLYIIDEKTKETLYIGEIAKGNNSYFYDQISILEKDEI